MLRRSHTLAAAIAIATFTAAEANAGCGGCAPSYVHPAPAYVQPGPQVVEVYEAPDEDSEIYIVNQGPTFSGPGAFRYQSPYVDRLAPRDYPYFGGYGYRPRYVIRSRG